MERTIGERIRAERRAVLSSLWMFVLLNMLFRDMHELVRPGAIEEFMSADVAEGTLVASGVALTVFISMIPLSRVLPYRAARLTNLTIPILALGGMFIAPPNDLDDVWFLAVEAVGLLAIIRLSWAWRLEHASAAPTTEDPSVRA